MQRETFNLRKSKGFYRMQEADQDSVFMAAALIGLTIAPECLPGVCANLTLLAEHAKVLRDWQANRSESLDGEGNAGALR